MSSEDSILCLYTVIFLYTVIPIFESIRSSYIGCILKHQYFKTDYTSLFKSEILRLLYDIVVFRLVAFWLLIWSV